MGLYHPWEEYHHIKKENIGLIEVMGLAVLPARLKDELEELKQAILDKKDIKNIEAIAKHADWVAEFCDRYDVINEENITDIIQNEIGILFKQILECAGVYKTDEKGREAFLRFINYVNIC